MNSLKKVSLTLLYNLLLLFTAYADQKGSDTIVSIEPFFTFPSSASDNAMLTFGFFRNGFALQDASTSCTFSSIYPVSGPINLRGGTLHLFNDLSTQNIATLVSSGTILANGHSIDLTQSITGIPASFDTILKDVNLFLNSDFLISGTVTFQGNCVLDGDLNSLTLDNNAAIIIDSNSTLWLRNVGVSGLNRTNLRCLDNSGSMILDNMFWLQNGDFTFAQGSINFLNNVNFNGPWNFSYESTLTSTVSADTTWYVAEMNTLSIGRQQSSYGREPLYFVDKSSRIKLENLTFNSTQYGMRFFNGVLLLDGEVGLDIDSTGSTTGLVFGNKLPGGDMLVKFAPAAILNFRRGDLVHEDLGISAFGAGNAQKIFIRHGVGTNYWSNTNSSFANVDLRYGIGGSTILAPGTKTYFSNTRLNLGPQLALTMTATRLSNFGFGLYNGGSMVIESGIFFAPLSIKAYGSSNTFTAGDDVSGSITLNDLNSSISLGIGGDLLTNLPMNGGTVILTKDLSFGQSAMFTGTGNLNLSKYKLNLGTADFAWTSSININGSGSSINLNALLELTTTITLTGRCQIFGNGNTLKFAPGGEIVVDRFSTLHLNQLYLLGVSNTNIRCIDDTASIILDEVKWMQNSNYTFTVGSLLIKKDCEFSGDGYSLVYQTGMTSTIDSNAVMRFDKGLTFSYDPINGRQDNIQFADRTAQMAFNNAHFYVTKGGIQFKKGELIIDGNVSFYSDYLTLLDTSLSNTAGIIFGSNNEDPANDILVNITGGSMLDMLNGFLIYRNINFGSLGLQNQLSTLQMEALSAIRLETSLPIAPGQLNLSTQAHYEQGPGDINIYGTVNMF